MRRSFPLGTYFNIPVRVHYSFAFLIVFVIYVGKSRDASWGNIALFGIFILCLFLCVLLHEFGHALSARLYGISTHDITILPIGGVARLDRLPERPLHELIVAIAGPAVNIVLFTLLSAILYIFFHIKFSIYETLTNTTNQIVIDPTAGFIANLMQANLMLAVFNMIPAFPLDGGRVLRALLSMSFGRSKATQWAALIGQILAIFFFLYAIIPLFTAFLPKNHAANTFVDWTFQPVLMLISFFVFYTARSEYRQTILDKNLASKPVKEVTRAVLNTLQTTDIMHTATSQWQKDREINFLVYDNDKILRGVLQDGDIQDALKNQAFDALVSTYMTVNFYTIQETDSLKNAYDKMVETGQSLLPVINTEGSVVGIIDEEILSKFI